MKLISKQTLTTLLALALVCMTAIGLTTAYFSAEDSAVGNATLTLSQGTTIDEGTDNMDKHIVISNSEAGTAVLVRVRVNGPDEPLMTVSTTGNLWKKGNDGWYYYTKVLAAGKSTEESIDAVIKKDLTEAEQFELGDNFNVLVTYEAAVATYNGSTVATPAGWDTSITFTEK